MLLNRQFGIEQNAKVAHDVGEIDVIVGPVPTVSDRSCDDSVLMAALDPIHIALSAFSCNRRELHHRVTSATQSLSCSRSLELSSYLALASSYVSSAYGITLCRR